MAWSISCPRLSEITSSSETPPKYNTVPKIASGSQIDTLKRFIATCDYFEDKGKVIASTLSLTVLVTIEMFNALNALSEECSLLVVPPHKNMYLVAAIVASFIAHFCILYIPPLASIFSVSPLTWREWKLVLWFSFPVIVIDEVLKLVGRLMDKKQRQNHVAEAVPLLSIQ